MFRQAQWSGKAIIGDSIIATMDTYDQRIYAIGKGPTQTTVEAPKTGIPSGSSVMVCGSVMDISAGTSMPSIAARFPNGVACVSDASMSDWMLYVYKQFARPTDSTGVTVKFAAYDPNGNYIELGDSVSDSYGCYGFNFKPDLVGQYMITATFEGSKAYYPSTAVTYLSVIPAPEPFPDVPTAEEIAVDAAQRTIAMLPPYPDVPTQEQIAHDAASRTIAMLPQYPTPYPPAEIPAYQTIDLVIIVLAIVGIIIGIFIFIRKK
jgi:hypothetical protein